MDLNERIILGNIESKMLIMKGMELSDEEINASFSAIEKSILEKAFNHKYIRKEGQKYIYEEPKEDKSQNLFDRAGRGELSGKEFDEAVKRSTPKDLDRSGEAYQPKDHSSYNLKDKFPVGSKVESTDFAGNTDSGTVTGYSDHADRVNGYIHFKDAKGEEHKKVWSSVKKQPEEKAGFSDSQMKFLKFHKKYVVDLHDNSGWQLPGNITDALNKFPEAHGLTSGEFHDLHDKGILRIIQENRGRNGMFTIVKFDSKKLKGAVGVTEDVIKGTDWSITKGEDSKESKVALVMREFKDGKLKSSSGESVTDHDQALAIAMSEAGLSKGEVDESDLEKGVKIKSK